MQKIISDGASMNVNIHRNIEPVSDVPAIYKTRNPLDIIGSLWILVKRLNQVQMLVLGYLLIVIIFACVLMLPVSSAQNTSQSFIDALFVATSGISTTGLTPVDVGSYYSLFGQTILMLDFQIGGIGYMSVYIFLFYLLRKRITQTTKIIAKESMAGVEIGNSSPFFLKVILFTLFFEIGGGIILCLFWMKQYPLAKSMFWGLFHSIAAFCTAGFGLLPDSLMSYNKSLLVNLTINVVSLAGGIGFFVLNEFFILMPRNLLHRKRIRFSIHSRLALFVTLGLLIFGTGFLFFAGNSPPSSSRSERLLDASFQTISASTTDGYNTIDIGSLPSACLVVIMLLMFVGASPGSTGGGIKTTTLGAIVLSVRSQLCGHADTNCLRRRISSEITRKSFSIFFLFFSVIIVDLLILCITEKGAFMQILFEIVSALGNTGLSMGITSKLSDVGKFVLSITMFIGRVGPLTIGMALIGRLNHLGFKYPEETMHVG